MSDKQYLKNNPKALKNIKHIVVLMLENRSFDNLLGWLYDDEKPPRGQSFEGLNPSIWNPLDNIDADGIAFTEQVYVTRNGESRHSKPWHKKAEPRPVYNLPSPDPGEGFKDTNFQLFGFYEVASLYPPTPVNSGFVNNYKNAMLYGTLTYGDAPSDPREIMTCYTPAQTPVLSTLAKQFAVCDHWFCSIPSQTLPNRDFVHAATSNGQVNNHPQADCDAYTIYNRIQDEINGGRDDLSWRIYSGTNKQGARFSLTRTIMTQLEDSALDDNFDAIEQFYKDASAGNLPSYSFLEPQFSAPGQNDQHPDQDIRPGEKLIADVYNAVINSPQWNETLLVITYDEHGGCFDHVPPPGHAAHPDGKEGKPGQEGFLFNRFGVRVPAVLISPWIQAGTIARPAGWTPFDHTSVISTVRHCFDLGDALTARDDAAPDLSCVLTLKKPRTDKPEVTPLAFKKEARIQVNALHMTSATVLAKRSGKVFTNETSDEAAIHKYLNDTYNTYFSKNNTARGAGLTALDETGHAIDWWFAYKVPDNVKTGGSKTSGFEYLYYDEKQGALKLSNHTLDKNSGALYQTLLKLFGDGHSPPPDSHGWILYNDEIPNTKNNNEKKGHSKGVIGFDPVSNSAFWLLHSIPRCPVVNQPVLPMDEHEYAQTCLCVTLPDVAAAEAIAQVMLSQQQPQVYDCNIPKGFDKNSALSKLASGKSAAASKTPATLTVTSKAGKAFTLMAKSRVWGEDFWIDLVGPTLVTDLAVETWRRGTLPGTEDANNKDDVEDVLYIDLVGLDIDMDWHYTKDHAKWAVSTGSVTTHSGTPWICIADINRQISQEKRGGGALAFQEAALWTALSKIDQISNK